MDKPELYELIDKYLLGEANEEEIDQLSRYYNSFQQTRYWNETELGQEDSMEAKIFQVIQGKIRSNDSEISNGNRENSALVRVFYLARKRKALRLVRIAAAACVIGLLALSAFLWVSRDAKKEIPQAISNNKAVKNDVPAGRNKAILKLADGSTIVLDDAQKGALPPQGNTKVFKYEGKIAYEPGHAASKRILFNTISTPRGGQYQIILADGTSVWLNAASSLHFPTSFEGKERRVEVTGEAYFEVARNETVPFAVSITGAEIRVLGTHFNVMAYADEAIRKTTLLEGSVKFIKDELQTILKPGQQSQLAKSGQIKVVRNIDIEEVMAWKNGYFYFEKANIETVMRQLARWYNVDVVYRNKKTSDLFHVDIQRDTKLSEVLKALQLACGVQLKIEGQKVIVF